MEYIRFAWTEVLDTFHTYVKPIKVRYRLGEYETESVLGAGGFRMTYQAYDTPLDTVVAIKACFCYAHAHPHRGADLADGSGG